MHKKMVPVKSPQSIEAEAYRILFTNLKFSSPDKPLQTLTVTSSVPAEGKSLTAANLALTATQNSEKVLLVDGDLRNPTQHQLFDIKNKPGLTDVILGNLDLPTAISIIKGLHVLPAGSIPPNPSQLLGSIKMRQLLRQMKEYAELVIIDTPPASMITDAALVASITDGVILVIESGKTLIDQAVNTKEILRNVRANILGVVINKAVNFKSKSYYYHYRYYSQK